MSDGDAVLLWRSGRGGGIAALCTVVGEPEAQPRPGGPPEVVVGLRIQRALSHPIAPATLVTHPVLRPLAFMDLLDTTEHRVTPRQEEALATLLAERYELAASADPDGIRDETRTSVAVPVRLMPLVEELLLALGAEDAAPAHVRPAHQQRPAASRWTEQAHQGYPGDPTDLQLAQAEQLAQRHSAETFTVDEAAATWRTGVGTARSRVERLLESGLMERVGTLRPEERLTGGSTRGRPPVLYRLTVAKPLNR
jgi:hypothetical protein